MKSIKIQQSFYHDNQGNYLIRLINGEIIGVYNGWLQKWKSNFLSNIGDRGKFRVLILQMGNLSILYLVICSYTTKLMTYKNNYYSIKAITYTKDSRIDFSSEEYNFQYRSAK